MIFFVAVGLDFQLSSSFPGCSLCFVYCILLLVACRGVHKLSVWVCLHASFWGAEPCRVDQSGMPVSQVPKPRERNEPSTWDVPPDTSSP